MSNPYRASQSTRQKADVGKVEVTIIMNDKSPVGPLTFKGRLDKSTQLPNVFIMRHAQDMFDAWKAAPEFYSGVDPNKDGSNGWPVEYFLIPKHAVRMIKYTNGSLFVEHEGRVLSVMEHTTEVARLSQTS